MAEAASLTVRVRHRLGALQVDVEFALTQPWTVLFGPSGSGKTTVLRAIAGLLRPEEGRIVLAGAGGSESLTMVDTGAGVFVPAHRRRIPLATQQPNLFPQGRVVENLVYGSPQPVVQERAGWAARAREALDEFGLTELAGKLPRELSGGEAQRLNLARAVMAAGARMLLLDEPFTGMDGARRDRLLPYLRERLARRGTPVLSVTHDVAEAFELGAEVIQIAEGRVVAQGPVEVVLGEERRRLLERLGLGVRD